jgi:hypothetical protein
VQSEVMIDHKKPTIITPHRVRKKEFLKNNPFDSRITNSQERDEDGIAF